MADRVRNRIQTGEDIAVRSRGQEIGEEDDFFGRRQMSRTQIEDPLMRDPSKLRQKGTGVQTDEIL